METLQIENSRHPTIEHSELASHELSILREELKRLDAKRLSLIKEIVDRENVIGKRDNVIFDLSKYDNILLKAEYCKKKTYAEKILFITEFPFLFNKKYVQGKGDIVEIMLGEEITTSTLDRETLKKKLNTSVPAILSRLIEEGRVLKYRLVNTKGKFVIVNPSWLLSNGDFKNEFVEIVKDLEVIKKPHKGAN